MTNVEQHILKLVTKLPPAAQAELIDFAEFLLQKHGQPEQQISALDILDEPLPDGIFQTADQVRKYLDEEA